MSNKDEHKKVDSRNIVKLVVSQFLISLGDVLINPKVTLPWLLQSLGAPLYLLGWLVPIRESGSLLPQIVIAHFIYKVKVRKWVWVIGSIVQSASVVGIGCAALLLDGASAGWAIISALIIFSVARGLTSVASKDVLGKTVEKEKRGRVTGWSSSASGLITIGIAICTMFFIDGLEGNTSLYVLGIVSATLIWLIAGLIYSFVQEPKSEVGDKSTKFRDVFKELELLKTDSVFRQFVIARSLFLCAALSAPYYVLIAQQRSESGVFILGLFIMASGLASLLSSPFWGVFSDSSSRKVMASASLLSAMIGIALFVTVEFFSDASFTTLFIVVLYFALNVAHQGVRIGRKTYLVNLGKGNKRTSYVSVSNTIIGIILLAMSSISLLSYSISLASIVLVFSIITLIGAYMAMRLPEV